MGDTILVVDDQPGPLRALATELGDAGFTVIEASDGREAWQRVCEDRPALVITDMVMPHSDGMELLSRIRSCEKGPSNATQARAQLRRGRFVVMRLRGSLELATRCLLLSLDSRSVVTR